MPGALLPNTSLRFVCRQVELEVVDAGHAVHCAPARRGERLSIPVKHTTGRYYAPEPVRRACSATPPARTRTARQDDIAGVRNEAGNVFGLMPHPEHAVDALTGSTDGLKIFDSIRAHVGDRVAA